MAAVALAFVLFLALMAVAFPAEAKCTARDKWTGPDKNKHAAAGLAIGWMATLQTRDPWAGLAVAAAVGVGKELADTLDGGACSLQDAAVTAAAGLIGAQLGGLAVVHLQGKTLITYRTTF